MLDANEKEFLKLYEDRAEYCPLCSKYSILMDKYHTLGKCQRCELEVEYKEIDGGSGSVATYYILRHKDGKEARVNRLNYKREGSITWYNNDKECEHCKKIVLTRPCRLCNKNVCSDCSDNKIGREYCKDHKQKRMIEAIISIKIPNDANTKKLAISETKQLIKNKLKSQNYQIVSISCKE